MPLQQPLADLDWLASTHVEKRLYLATGSGLQGCIHLNGNREAMVDELIRLARIGQHCERAAVVTPDQTVAQAVDETPKPRTIL